ncbi:hypothetical protein PT974_12529 [Cladobotryum mycophilum]|uniref:CBM-cenC domain-containing protein n=1 Tax=Cladobotryum mycophilum TaxID=491253 RepID=A0ABR0S876_9HYPO
MLLYTTIFSALSLFTGAGALPVAHDACHPDDAQCFIGQRPSQQQQTGELSLTSINMVTNGDFKSGDVEPWTFSNPSSSFIEPVPGPSGADTNLLFTTLTPGKSLFLFSDTFSLEAGSAYTVSYTARNSNFFSNTSWGNSLMSLASCGGKTMYTLAANKGEQLNNSFVKFQGQFTVPANSGGSLCQLKMSYSGLNYPVSAFWLAEVVLARANA